MVTVRLYKCNEHPRWRLSFTGITAGQHTWIENIFLPAAHTQPCRIHGRDGFYCVGFFSEDQIAILEVAMEVAEMVGAELEIDDLDRADRILSTFGPNDFSEW